MLETTWQSGGVVQVVQTARLPGLKDKTFVKAHTLAARERLAAAPIDPRGKLRTMLEGRSPGRRGGIEHDVEQYGEHVVSEHLDDVAGYFEALMHF